MPPPPVYSPPPIPPTKLGRYRTLSPLAGVRVSPLQLGAMSVGDKWQEFGMGSMNKTSSFKLLDAYFDAGVRHLFHFPRLYYIVPIPIPHSQGNFIDTANT